MIVQSAIASSSRRRKFSAAASQKKAFNAVLLASQHRQREKAVTEWLSSQKRRSSTTSSTNSTQESDSSSASSIASSNSPSSLPSRSTSRSGSVSSSGTNSAPTPPASASSKSSSSSKSSTHRAPKQRAISLLSSFSADPFTLAGDEHDHKSNQRLGLVDLSNYNLASLPAELVSKENAEQIEHLILDGNLLTEAALEECPPLPNLKSLSLNANKLKNIGVVLQLLARKCPKLCFLSLIGNPGWPHPIINPDEKLYQKHVRAAAKLLPCLHFLDSTSIRADSGSSSEKEEEEEPLLHSSE